MSRGLRQEDPVSSFLFTIVVEALSALFQKTKEIDLIEPLLLAEVKKLSLVFSLQMTPLFLVPGKGRRWR